MSGLETGLGDRLAGELTSLAICWRLVRRDGVALGFTTHDQPLVIAGMQYESAPGMAPSAVVASDGLDVETMDVAGALRADAITAEDLREGRFDGAEVRLFMVDWRDPGAGQHMLAQGNLGTIEAGIGGDSGFSATMRGQTAVFARTGIEVYSPACRAELGDWRCRVAMRGRVLRSLTNAVAGDRVWVAGVDAAAAAGYVAGRLRISSGRLAGLERRIIAAEGDALRLDEVMAVAAGERVELLEGCDKQFATCAGRFGNAPNFRGEPHVPGNDVLTRFGGL
jgi:uncharacterized phage protein (TIGR02218 family)